MDELKPLNDFDARLLTALEAELGKGYTRDELFTFVNEGGFDGLLSSLGLDEAVEAFVLEFQQNARATANRLKKSFIASEIERVGQIVNYESEITRKTLLGYFTANSERVKHELNKSIIAGQTSKQTIENLRNTVVRVSDKTTHILTDANVSAVVGTAYNDISRSVVKAAFEENPEQRFRYEGSTVPTSSPICEWVKENQPKEGYTIDEINKGIKVPPNQPTSIGKDTGKGGIVNFNGRVPNYNCDDEWLPVD